jgi:hypothetical protein
MHAWSTLPFPLPTSDPSRVLAQQAHALLLRPAYVLIADDLMRCVVLCIRGTQSTKDLFTSLAGEPMDPLGPCMLKPSHACVKGCPNAV